MEIIIAIVALCVAIWQLYLQRLEIINNGKINALIHLSTMTKEEIVYRRLLQKDGDKKYWQSHTDKINKVLRPQLENINKEIVKLSLKSNTINMQDILKNLNLHDDEQSGI